MRPNHARKILLAKWKMRPSRSSWLLSETPQVRFFFSTGEHKSGLLLQGDIVGYFCNGHTFMTDRQSALRKKKSQEKNSDVFTRTLTRILDLRRQRVAPPSATVGKLRDSFARPESRSLRPHPKGYVRRRPNASLALASALLPLVLIGMDFPLASRRRRRPRGEPTKTHDAFQQRKD